MAGRTARDALEQYAPVTWSIGLLQAPAEQVAEQLCSWREEIGRAVTSAALPSGLGAAIDALAPYTAPWTREVVLGTNGQWSAIFDNSAIGGDPTSSVSYLAGRLRVPGLVVLRTPYRPDAKGARHSYQGTAFRLYSPDPVPGARDGNGLRSVDLIQDDNRWHFGAWGEQQEYEDVARYASRRVRDRFDEELLRTYCSALGADYLADDFFRGPSYLIRSHPARGLRNAGSTFAEIRQSAGLPPDWPESPSVPD
ncbi:hypothetical protein [Curtobacterium sp. MCBD17_040]|uniref:hypothetical protein n=1 Tax=Curtobacterium sp. MCBD17_040 TaxID=2175674 RepID=UPI0024DFCE45|nr:hypothetical protein [Curtobacterium sp. MCBD17_040]WIB63754.1 hypothetical protein DEI94_00780 [Curtobacterium sp. MCBD17_040]